MTLTVLHILRTEPDETVQELMEAFAVDESTTISLFEEEVDWPGVVDQIFAAEKTICWW